MPLPGVPAPRFPLPIENPAVPCISTAQATFLAGLIDPPAPRPIDDCPRDDRAFLAGVRKRLHKRELELPVLPEVSIRLSRMLRQGVVVGEYVSLLNNDAALSLEVLRTANSAFYGAATPITTLHQAVVRIGLVRLQAILMNAHLRLKMLKGGAFKTEAATLLDLALPMGFLASRFGSERSTAQDTCFMRGVLMHIEHLVVLGAVNEVSRDLRRVISPSVGALHQAFVQFGPDIRQAVAVDWNLSDLLIGGDNSARTAAEYDRLRLALVCQWMGRPLPAIDGVDQTELARALIEMGPQDSRPDHPTAVDLPGAAGGASRHRTELPISLVTYGKK